MTKEEALKQIESLDILNKHLFENISKREYIVTHVSESKDLNSDEHFVQVSLSDVKNTIYDITRVEKYSTIQSDFTEVV